MILLISNEEDVTTDFVVARLRAPYMRINLEHWATRGELALRFTHADWEGWLEYEGKSTCLSDVSAVYYRRPGIIEAPAALIDEGAREYSRREHSNLVGSLNRLVTATWINHPLAAQRAESKPWQLTVALQLGMRVPATLIGNSPARARAFLDQTSAAVAKTLRQPRVWKDDSEHLVYTSNIDADDRAALETIRLAPCILQERIDKTADIRVTVVGGSVFPVLIESQAQEATRTDWRVNAGTELVQRGHDLPDKLVQQCVALTRGLGLEFAAVDFALDDHGEYWFLEANPQGQWAWMDVCAETSIAAAIAARLERAYVRH